MCECVNVLMCESLTNELTHLRINEFRLQILGVDRFARYAIIVAAGCSAVAQNRHDILFGKYAVGSVVVVAPRVGKEWNVAWMAGQYVDAFVNRFGKLFRCLFCGVKVLVAVHADAYQIGFECK